MKKSLVFILSLALLLTLLPGGATLTSAQGPQPPSGPPEGPPGPWRKSPDGHWFMPQGSSPPQKATDEPQATGGPDDFGYIWDDSVPLSWIDASGGTDTGINSSTDHVGPIDTGFSFKYYENAYTQLYISRFGFVAFNDGGIYNSQSRIPSPSKPNDVIAPHWVPAYSVNGYVRYLRGGTAPNRWFIVEWNRLESDCCGDDAEEYTFEVILHENGDIVFQYGTMTVYSGYYCQASGIEDSTGLDGLSITDFCRQIEPNHAVRIYRPAPSARVSVRPPYQGRFIRAGETAAFQVPIRNSGDLGADTYTLAVSSTWPAAIYAADGVTPLTNTGSVAQGGTTTVVVKVQTPAIANVGDADTATLTVRSSLDPSKSKTATLRTAVPAPFAQVYGDDADGAMSLYLAQPSAQTLKKTTADKYYGYSMAVAEMPSSFAYFWTKGRSVGSEYVHEIEYTLLDRYGNTTRGVSKLTDHSGAAMSTHDESPALAVAPNGHIGVLWYRYLWNDGTSQSNYNIYFAILDAAGNLAHGPLNLTNNTAWGDWDDLNVPRFYYPRIAATGDNRFVLAWQRYSRESGGSLSDVYYAVRDANGGAIKGVTKFTNGAPGGNYYSYPALAALSGNRALLAYSSPGGIAYAMLDSGGNTVKPETTIGGSGWGPDAVQISDGNIVVAWGDWSGSVYEMAFAVLGGTTYNVVAGPTTLTNPAAVTGDDYVSAAADANGHAILTWMDYDWSYRPNLYYALVDGSGNVLTDPLIFCTSQATEPRIETSYEGYGNTSYSLVSPTTSDVDARVTAPSMAGGPPGGTAAVSAWAGNYGRTTATSVVCTATLDSHLAYASAVPTPSSVSTHTVVWNLPDMDFLGEGSVLLRVAVPSATIGTRYPVSWTLTSAGPEAKPSDNTATTEVMVARQVFLPLVLRDY